MRKTTLPIALALVMVLASYAGPAMASNSTGDVWSHNGCLYQGDHVVSGSKLTSKTTDLTTCDSVQVAHRFKIGGIWITIEGNKASWRSTAIAYDTEAHAWSRHRAKKGGVCSSWRYLG